MRNFKYIGIIGGLLTTSCIPVGKEAIINVEECAGDADIDDTTFIVWEFEDSIHEMITCGSLTYQLITGLYSTVGSFLSGESSLPDAFSYEDGAYLTTGDGVSMDLTFYYGANSPGGNAGSQIEHNLFDINSYFINPTVEQSGEDMVISFDDLGPLISLLGMGSNPASPLTMSAGDITNFAAIIGTLKLDSNIYVDHQLTLSTVQYEIDNSPSFIVNLFTNLSMDMDKATATAEREDLSQNLDPTLWDIKYIDSAKNLEGVIEADIVGGPFDFHAVLDYNPLVSDPQITISCLKE
jgi:hypothetical protein